jgi:UvrD/REP helicase N-terminal domain
VSTRMRPVSYRRGPAGEQPYRSAALTRGRRFVPDSALDEDGFEPLVPCEKDGIFRDDLIDRRPFLLPENQATPREGDRRFESVFFQQTVRLSPDFALVPGKARVFRQCGEEARRRGRHGEQKRNTKLQPIDGRRHLHNLNPEDRSAVEYGIGGNDAPPPALLIAAGAGTGKTKALAHRVAHLILNGRDPQRLLLLTFTRRAGLEMTRRSQLILAEARGSTARDIGTPSSLLPWSGTFHAIGSRLLRLHAGSIASLNTFSIISAVLPIVD